METYRHEVYIIIDHLDESEEKLIDLQNENFSESIISQNIEAALSRLRDLQDCIWNLYHEFNLRSNHDVINISLDDDDDGVVFNDDNPNGVSPEYDAAMANES
jgi:hypothetical protein